MSAIGRFVRSDLDRRWSLGMGFLSGLASAGTLAFGVAQAQTGFSETSMAFQTGLYAGVLWIVATGVFLHRFPVHDGRLARNAEAPGQIASD